MDNREILLYNDLKTEYEICAKTCKMILATNQSSQIGFVFYRYIDFKYIFEIREKNKRLKNIKQINIIHPSSKKYSEHPYESFWIDNNNSTILNIISSFALIYISNQIYLHTPPVWKSFLRKLIQLFRGIKVIDIRF